MQPKIDQAVRILFVGDIIGRPGRKFFCQSLPSLISEYSLDIVVANGENLAGGFGLNPSTIEEVLKAGVNVITTGNHVFDKKEVIPCLSTANILRPHNYPSENPGKGVTSLYLPSGHEVFIINLQGKILMPPIECPFRTLDEILKIIPKNSISFLDFHAEATSEKVAMGFYADGRISAMAGSHTHIPTADETILPMGTGYITDAGMTGPYLSVIGMRKEDSLEKMIKCIPKAMEVAKKMVAISGIYFDINIYSGHCINLERVFIKDDTWHVPSNKDCIIAKQPLPEL